jgi:hypothetical protein
MSWREQVAQTGNGTSGFCMLLQPTPDGRPVELLSPRNTRVAVVGVAVHLCYQREVTIWLFVIHACSIDDSGLSMGDRYMVVDL